MSFSAKTENLVNELIQAEYKNACDNFGEKYHSLHEGYAVLLEEVEEVEPNISSLKENVSMLWKYIKKNDWEVVTLKSIENSLYYMNNAIKELAQVGAVLMKIKNTLEKSDDTNVSIKRKVCNTDCEHIFKSYGEHFCYAQKICHK